MRCLLVAINSKYIHSNPAVYLLRECALRDLQQKQISDVEIELAEYTINHHASEIFDDIYLHHADLVCFSCYIWNIEYVRQLVRNLKNLCPNVKIWVGGPEVSYDCESFLRSLPQVDGILYGEGERSFPALLEYYAAREDDAARENNSKSECDAKSKKRDMRDAADQAKKVNPSSEMLPNGAAWLDENGVFHQTSPQPLTPMDELPFIYEEAGRMEGFQNRIIYYETSRGCPFSCSYCLSSIDKKLRFRPLDTVKKELAFFLEQRVPQVKFVDRTFNCKKSHAMAIWQFIRDFAAARTTLDEKTVRQVLTFDYYLRDYARKRPSFALEQDSYKEEIRAVCLNEFPDSSYKDVIRDYHIEVLVPPFTDTKQFVLFDYQHRDPLDQNATIRVLTWK